MSSLFAVARAAAVCAVIAGCRSAASPADESPARGTDASVTDGLLAPDAAAGDSSLVDARALDGAPIDAGDMPAIHVLFIGNSYTFVNDLPGMLRALAASSHAAPSITTEQVTPGGTTLQDNYLGPDARPAIAKKAFTHVVLQGQSVEPLLQPAVFEKYALLLAGEARDAGAVPTFYETWARRSGDAFYQDPLSGGSPGVMQDTLATEYAKVAAAGPSGTLLAKVGDGWRSTLATQPGIVMHQPDGSHPTVAGTLLAAYVLYITLTGHDVPAASAVPAGVTPADAAALHAIALSVTH